MRDVPEPRSSMKHLATDTFRHALTRTLLGSLVLAVLTAICYRMQVSIASATLLYLVVVVFVSLTSGFVSSVFVSIVAILCLNYFFTAPLYSIAVAHPMDVVALVVFLTTSAVITRLMSTVRKSYRQIEALRDQLRLVVDTIPTLAWSALPDGSRDYLNQRWLEYTGLDVEAGLGMGWKALFHPDDVARFEEEWNEALTSGEPLETEARVRRADGEYRWLLIRAVPLRGEQGNIIKWYGTSTDIEDHKRAGEALHQAQVELAHVTRVTTLGELAASIAHEINQPLAAIVTDAHACLHWLNADDPPLQEVREALNAIANDGNRAAEVIARIRALISRSALAYQPCDVTATIHEVLPLVQPELVRHGILLQAALAPDLPQVRGDRVQLQQVLLNLLLNAADASREVEPERRRLAIRSSVELLSGESWAVVAVEDSGVGFGEKLPDRLFEAFYTTKPGGLGMGLSISHSIIEAHGGRLWATANPEHGATFQFRLPAMP